jgi:NADH pyrophosphatase NudC (nudix superfamily)
MKYCPECAVLLGEREHESRSYKACEACGFTHWENPTPVVAALVELNNKVVLVHNKLWPKSMLGLVSGFLERCEDPEPAIRREVNEELGLQCEQSTLIGVYGFAQQNQVIIAYHVKCRGEIMLGDELDRFKLLDPEQVKAWDLGTGPAVRDWLASRDVDTK